jgi:hypothetical protein
MSIRLLAIELYRVMKRVDELEEKLRNPSLSPSEREQLEKQLRAAVAERDRIKAILAGAKEM